MPYHAISSLNKSKLLDYLRGVTASENLELAISCIIKSHIRKTPTLLASADSSTNKVEGSNLLSQLYYFLSFAILDFLHFLAI